MARLLKIILAMYRTFQSVVLLLLLFTFTRCTKPVHYPSPAGYNLAKAFQVKLPLELDEISGVAYYPKDTTVFAINDEKGWLYKIGVGTDRHITRWKFSKGADFEDIALVDSAFFILQSNGNITRVTFVDSSALVSKLFTFPYTRGNEFEILYYDGMKRKLVLICKDCETDKKKALTTFTFDPQTEQYSDASFSIETKMIAATLGKSKVRFKPSAAAINPVDSMLYIISAVNKVLVITDRDGNYQKSYPIDPTIFKQPEGLTFTPSGGLIISNESANVGVADILFFSPGKIRS